MLYKLHINIVISLIFCACVFVSGIFIFAYASTYRNMTILSLDNVDVSTTQEYAQYVDSVSQIDSLFVLEGWGVKRGTDYSYVDVQVILRAPDGRAWVVPTRSKSKPEITSHFNDGNNYDNAGILAVGNVAPLESDIIYNIFFLFEEFPNTQILLPTGATFKVLGEGSSYVN